jgi:hypothetical protein
VKPQASTRWPSDIRGVAHNSSSIPDIIGWRTWRYSAEVLNGIGVQRTPRSCR